MTDVIAEGKESFHRARVQKANLIQSASILYEAVPPGPLEGLNRGIKCVKPTEREMLERVAASAKSDPYKVALWRLVKLPEATVYCFSRIEGFVVSKDGWFVKESRGSPLIWADNPYVRSPDKENWYFNNSIPFDGELDRAFVPFDPATANYAHFLLVFLQRIIAASPHLKDMPILFPDLPDFQRRIPSSMRNEFFFRLPEIHPLTNGNFYFPLPQGKWRIKELFILQPVIYRWDHMFYPDVSHRLHEIGTEGLRRYRARQSEDLPDRIYVSRALADRRRILNEECLQPILLDSGFKTIFLERHDFWDQVALFANAKKIISVHGGGCANLVFSKGADFLEIHPNPLPSDLFINTAFAQGSTYSSFGTEPANKNNDIEINIESFQKFMKEFLAD